MVLIGMSRLNRRLINESSEVKSLVGELKAKLIESNLGEAMKIATKLTEKHEESKKDRCSDEIQKLIVMAAGGLKNVQARGDQSSSSQARG